MSVRSLLSESQTCAWCTAVAVVLSLCAVIARPAQTPETPPKPAPTPAEPVKHLDAWPKLEVEAVKGVKTDIERLRKAHTTEMALSAEEALVAAGAAIVPHLLPTLPKEQEEEAKLRIRRTLEKVTGPEHSRLLQAEFENKSVEIRAWSLRRCATWRDAGLKPAAEASLARAQKLADKADPEELYAAALCATSAGSTAGLESLRQWAIDAWGRRGVEMRTALEGVRSPEGAAVVTAWLKESDYPKPNAPMLPPDDRRRVVASLNMLAGCGDRGSLTRVKPFLDSTDNSIRIAAINAVRGIADGEPPVADLPVFDAIELAKKLKTK